MTEAIRGAIGEAIRGGDGLMTEAIRGPIGEAIRGRQSGRQVGR
jgi:hypothetical protein